MDLKAPKWLPPGPFCDASGPQGASAMHLLLACHDAAVALRPSAAPARRPGAPKLRPTPQKAWASPITIIVPTFYSPIPKCPVPHHTTGPPTAPSRRERGRTRSGTPAVSGFDGEGASSKPAVASGALRRQRQQQQPRRGTRAGGAVGGSNSCLVQEGDPGPTRRAAGVLKAEGGC